MEIAPFRPRVREVDPHRGQRIGRHAIEERQQIAVDDADVMEPAVLDRVEHGHHTRSVNLDTDDIEVWLGGRHLESRFTVAEPDIEHDIARCTRFRSEHLGPVERRTLDVEAPSLDPLVERCLALR